jgi:hypothetical protein
LRTVRQSQPHSRPISAKVAPAACRAPCPTARGVVKIVLHPRPRSHCVGKRRSWRESSDSGKASLREEPCS